MIKLTEEELKTVLADHSIWFESRGGDGGDADLTDADLIGAYLTDAVGYEVGQ